MNEKINSDMELEVRAEKLQEVYRRACQKHIGRRNINEDEQNEWFDNELKHLKTEMRKIRRNWQRTKTPQTEGQYIERRNAYKKMIKKDAY